MKIIDQPYHCEIPSQPFGPWKLHCHLSIFQSQPDVQIVMVTDMGFEVGWFIPSLVEALIEHIVKEFHLNPTQLVWIEHYTPAFRKLSCADFSQVTFDWQNGQAVNLRWTAIAPEKVQVLICEDLLLA